MHKLRYKLGLAALSLLAALGLASGVAHADAQPGTTETNSSSTVQVDQPADSNSNITVTTDNSSTTTVGPSSDGQSSTPAVTINNGDAAGGTTPTASDPNAAVVQNTEQTHNDNAQPGSTVNQSGSGQNSAPAIGQNNQTPAVPIAQLTRKQEVPAAPVAPPTENKSQQPAPIPTNGTIAPVLIGSSGSTGRGFSAKTARLNVGILAGGALILLAFMSLVSGSFMAYLRRSRFRHAPRSDASVSLFSFVTPSSKLQVQPAWATPVFFAGVNQATNTFRKGGEWI